MHQLVLQFAGDSTQDLDALIALEDSLIEELGDSADVDGHDIGSGECNIFIFTEDPLLTFERAKSVLERSNSLKDVKAAYRLIGYDKFTTIWPDASHHFQIA